MQAQRAADGLVPAGRVWAWNQAVLDLGALVCRPAAPGCDRCPLGAVCRWRGGREQGGDPALGSAQVSRPQGRYEGSDRQARGRLMAALTAGPVTVSGVAAVMGVEAGRATVLVGGLVADGLVERTGDVLRYPG